MKFPSAQFDAVVAAACHGTATEEDLVALGHLLQHDDAALDTYLLRTELHAALLTTPRFSGPVDLAALAAGGGSGPQVAKPARDRLLIAATAVAALSLLLVAWLTAGRLLHPVVEATAAKIPAAIVGSFLTLEAVEWVAPETTVRQGDPLRAGQLIEMVRGTVQLGFTSGASVRLSGPAIFRAESPLAAVLTMGRVAVTADTPESKGFTLRTRTGRIVDLGTEFTAEALPDGRCRIGVASGLVSFHPGQEGAGQLLRAGDLMEVEPGHRQVITRIERGDETPAFKFPTIKPPAADDRAGSGQSAIRRVFGDLYENPRKQVRSAPPEILLDGKGQSNPDAPEESLYFADAQTGGLHLDLGAPVAIQKINVYSWHRCLNPGFDQELRQAHRERAAQNYVIYGSAAKRPPRLHGSLPDPGWTLIARVNSDAYFGLTGTARPAQQASSITSGRGTIGQYRHLLLIVQPTVGINHNGTDLSFGTFFGEIDVHGESVLPAE